MLRTDSPLERGRKLVVQMVETFQAGGKPTFVDQLDAVAGGRRRAACALAPVMIYGDDVTHVLTEEGIAYLYKARFARAAARDDRGGGRRHARSDCGTIRRGPGALRREGLVALPEDLGVDRNRRHALVARGQEHGDLVDWSGGLYDPPARFRSW